MQKLPKKFFGRDAVTVAKELLGCILEKDGVSGMIMETEAYSDDEASHAFTKTPRSMLMHETHGHAYVYFTYGMHYCFNVTCDNKKQGAVLIRALLPVNGISKMKKRRKMTDEKNLTNGPAKLTQALNINKKDNGTLIGENIHIYNCKKFHPKNRIDNTHRYFQGQEFTMEICNTVIKLLHLTYVEMNDIFENISTRNNSHKLVIF